MDRDGPYGPNGQQTLPQKKCVVCNIADFVQKLCSMI